MSGDSATLDEVSTDSAAAAPKRRVPARWRLILTVLVAAASVGLAGVLYLTQYRTDVQTDEAATSAAVRAASEGTVALLSYKPGSADTDLAAAKTHLTGEFLNYYGTFSDEILLPAAKERAVSTEASVVRAADAEIHPDTAKVLVFVNQTTTSRERPDASQTASSVMVSLMKVDGRWLISAFDPI
ncbi:twin-arginine translocation pathway signal [Mycolicibacterium baixiangningiae]|uniref:twin-arginine translocation pathway signal n=1 Tax=Mycolicibacterium baixiangningiae TaxID=2761578 RepID=UPI001E2F7A27|nr:twin-arginine translocation pathway signal [Mycolicibacterium baixiangningiae]